MFLESNESLTPLKQYRSKKKGFVDLLNYGFFVERGTIYCKDGSLLVGYRYNGQDLLSAENDRINEAHGYIHQALNLFADGAWTIHFDTIRTRIEADEIKDVYRPSNFNNKTSEFIDSAMKAGELFKNINTIMLSYTPPSIQEQKFDRIFTNKDNFQDDINTLLILDDFHKKLKSFEDVISLGMEIEKMENRHLLRHINFCISGQYVPLHFPDYPPVQKYPPFIDSFLGHNLETGYTPLIDGKIMGRCAFILSIGGFPPAITPGALARLENHSIEYRINHRFICLDQLTAQKNIKRFGRKWRQSIQGIIGSLLSFKQTNNYAHMMAGEAESALTESQAGELFGLYTPVILLWGDDQQELQDKAGVLRKTIIKEGFMCRVEDVNANEAYFGSLPSNSTHNIRRPLISAGALAALISISSVWTGEKFCPSPMFPKGSPPLLFAKSSVGDVPFRLNLHVSDVGHTLIFGPTGAGKSTLLAIIASQFRKYPESNVFMFDQGYSLFPITLAAGGDHYDLGNSARLHFCPFEQIKKTDIPWAVEWLSAMIALQDKEKITAKESELLSDALKLLLTAKGADEAGGKMFEDIIMDIESERLKTALKPYADSFFNHESDKLSINKFLCFEMEQVMRMGEKFVIPLLLYLFKRIEDKLDGNPSLIILDEAWLMLGHPVFKEKIREWLKTLRKKNCAVVMATQSLSDATHSGIMDILSESCPTKIFLPNASANEPYSKKAYEALNVTQRQLDIISSAMPKRDYYYVSPSGTRLFSMNLNKTVLDLIASTSTKAIKQIKGLHKKDPENWIEKFLKYTGGDYEKFKNSGP